MSTTCKQCQRYEKRLRELHEDRTNFWRRGILTDEASEQLCGAERRAAEEMKKHQAEAHGLSTVASPHAA
jgi:hypothetical protein